MSPSPAVDPEALRDALAGDVVAPGEDAWDGARQAWNLVADQRPALVVLAATPADIAATVRFARANGLRVAPQSTGHGAASLGDLAGAILLRTGRLSGVAIDADARTAQVGAGARWGDVVAAAGESGLAAMHGFAGGVGVAGYTLGGGLGWLGRLHGFASSHVRSFDIVTAGGRQRHVDAEHEPELFWALRGGGGGPVVVTSLELELLPLREAYAGSLMWPLESASEIVQAYREWIASVPDELTSTLRLMRYPPLPELPEALRGKQLVVVTLAFTGSHAEGDAQVAPLRALGPRHLDTLATVPATALGAIAGDPEGPLPGTGDSLLLDAFTAEAAAAFAELGGPGVESPFTQLEIRHLGGALRDAGAGAAGGLEADALVYAVGVPVTPEVDVALHASLAAVRERLAPWTAARGPLLTFAEQQSGLGASFTGEVAERLAGVAAHYDPDGVLLANHVD